MKTQQQKAEEMTHLRGDILVPKTDARIIFRGKLDSLQAEILLMQTAAQAADKSALLQKLQDVLDFTRAIMKAEVTEEILPPVSFEGMDEAKLREASHHIKETTGIDHPVPSYEMGALALQLNALRAHVRETELQAVRAFTDDSGACGRLDIIQGLNRLSSYVYILFCREVL